MGSYSPLWAPAKGAYFIFIPPPYRPPLSLPHSPKTSGPHCPCVCYVKGFFMWFFSPLTRSLPPPFPLVNRCPLDLRLSFFEPRFRLSLVFSPRNFILALFSIVLPCSFFLFSNPFIFSGKSCLLKGLKAFQLLTRRFLFLDRSFWGSTPRTPEFDSLRFDKFASLSPVRYPLPFRCLYSTSREVCNSTPDLFLNPLIAAPRVLSPLFRPVLFPESF